MLIIENLTFAYRARRLFQDLHLRIEAGELVHLAGPNGAGKSTLMAIVAGLLAPLKGTISYEPGDRNQASAADDRRQFMEYLPAEANGLFLKMDATENLLFWTKLRGLTLGRDAIHTALGRWDLDHPLLRERFPVEKFSTGMKRRLALARLALSPAPLWLLDEPLYGLDQKAIGMFQELLREHLTRGGLGLVVSHELRPLEGLVTRTLTL